MKKAILSVILLASGLLSGCSSEESVSRPETAGQTGTLTFSFPAPRRSVTYAIGGETTGETDGVTATANEAAISDVTVYMFRNSGNELLVAKKTASSEEVGLRTVTFDVDDFTANSADYVFYAVANVNGNITDDFTVGQTTLDYFTATVATNTGTAKIPGINMLMVGYVTIQNLSSDTGQNHTINLRHRVARFDIDNTADDGIPDNNDLETGDETFFEITKINVLNTLSEGYLTEETNGQTRTPLAAKVSLIGDNAINASGIDNINNGLAPCAFYLWPGVLDKGDNLTDASSFIEVEGTYTIDNSVRLYRVQLPDSLDIEANKRYTLKVSRIGQKALAFRLEVSDWGDGAEVTATPPSGAFEYSGFELNDIPLADDRIDLSDNTGANTLKFFTLSENKETGELKASLVLDLGAGYAEEYVLENDVTPVAEGAPVVTYAGGKIKKTYSITLAKTIYPIGGKLTIEDEKTGLDTTFQIMSVLLYDNTEYRPVLVGGYYWAPVNVGATSAVYSETVESCGYIFQWGRSYTEFPYNSVGATYSGSLSAADAYTNRDKFILSGTDWLNPSNDALWSGADAQGPCPDGWKVPTADEWRALQNKCTGAIFDNHCLVISSDAVPSNASLYLPAAGRRSGSNGTFSGQGGAGFYWSSTSFVSSTNAYHFTFSASVDAPVNVNVFGEARSRGFSVRCIQK